MSIENTRPFGLRTIMELFDVGPAVAITALSSAALIIAIAVFYFIRSAPPTSITISSGPEGSIFQKNALKYAHVLEENGVKVNVLTSNGSLQNLERLNDPKSGVDVGFAQSGIRNIKTDNLISLGSISYQPLLIFYRGKEVDLLSAFEGKRIAIGPEGSGTRNIAAELLDANGIKEGGKTTLLDWEGDQASDALINKKIDAIFVMNESTSIDSLKKLLHTEGIHLFGFRQANAYVRKFDSLNILELPEGSIDLGKDIPAHDRSLLGPMVELVAKKNLHPALSDLLLEAAVRTHSRPGVFQKRGEFPSPIEHSIKISEDANRFYKSGKSLLYRYLPFWLASLTSRIVVVFIPMLVVLIPVMKSIPAFFRWRMQMKIRRRYRELLKIEQDFLMTHDKFEKDVIRQQFDRIDRAVNEMKVRAAYAEQFYGLRGHIDFVRQLVIGRQA